MSSSEKNSCVLCKQDSHQVPLVSIQYRDQQLWICSQHMPVLIHEPHKLAGVLPGTDKLEGVDHQ
jgi:hypothetical protein